MSGQAPPTQRVRRNASPSSAVKQLGPIRATLPISSLMRQSSASTPPTTLTSSNIINFDGGARTRAQKSPENRYSPERRSPSSPNFKDSCQHLYKEKSKTLNFKSNASPNIRRTASLDTIYLNGQWPRDHLHTYCGRPMVDKFTQTPDEWEELFDKKVVPPSNKQTNAAAVANSDQLEKIRQRLQRSKESTRHTSANGLHHSPVHGDHSAISLTSTSNVAQPPPLPPHALLPSTLPAHTVSRAITIPSGNIPKAIIPRMRNSVEGLNQPIHEPTPDGHRAPIADLFRHTRNVDTQTPSGAAGGEDESSQSASPASNCHSVSPIIPGAMDSSRPSSQNGADAHCQDVQYEKDDSKSASPEPSEVQLGTSPCINKFLAREPPDGCERVKIVEESRKSQPVPFDPFEYCRPKPSSSVFKPSSSSAFYPPFKGFDPSESAINLAIISSATSHSQVSPTSVVEGQ